MTDLRTNISSLTIKVAIGRNPKQVEFWFNTPVSKNDVFTYDFNPKTGIASRNNERETIDQLTEDLAQAIFGAVGVGCYRIFTLGFMRDAIFVDKDRQITVAAFVDNVVATIQKVFNLPAGRVNVDTTQLTNPIPVEAWSRGAR